MTARVRAALATAVLAVAAMLAGCGDDAPPAERVPSLASDLERVDEAIVARDFDRAEAVLDDIEAATGAALADGTLPRPDADRILAAVTALRGALAERREEPAAPESSPTEEPPTSPPDEDEEDEDEGEEDENGENGKGKDEKDDKGDKENKEDKENGKRQG